MAKIAIIGMGNMGTAIFEQLRAAEFEVRGVDKGNDVNEAVEWGDFLVLAVKPQDFESLCGEIEVDVSGKVCVSIMAGVEVARVSAGMKCEKVVRVMPNLALKVGKSMSGWFATEVVSAEEREVVRKILQSFGEEIEVADEDKIDAITALAGSGPAYFYKLTEILASAGEEFGFSEEEARKIAKGTFVGAAAYAAETEESVSELKAKVSSKGGTTAAAIKKMEEKGIDEVVKEGVKAAYNRAKEL
jgi:pyrroline-5-carboxylate reductase